MGDTAVAANGSGACPMCGYVGAEPSLRFCGQCGTRLAAPPESGGAIVPRRDPAGGPERRQVTVMFCDLVGSSTLAQQLELEEFRDLILAFQDRCTSIVQRFGGEVSRFMGDALLVVFGYPRADESASERAVLAGLELVAGVSRLPLQSHPQQVLGVRVGIATGMAVVGDRIGEGAWLEQAVLGETPNLASRLQGLAPPDSVIVSGATRELIGSRFLCENLGMQSLKGFDAPVPVWRVSGVQQVSSRFQALRSANLPPLVDRHDEMRWLDDLWQAATQGQGRVALIGGEPGIGKSRLVEALRQRVAQEQAACIHLQCSPYYTNRALHPVVEYIEGAAFMDKEDAPKRKVERLAQWLGAQTGRTHAMALLGGLLSIPAADLPPLPSMTASRQKALVFRLLTDLIQGVAVDRPLMLVCEDLQWIDPTSEALLSQMMAGVRLMPIFIVGTHRPEFVSAWPDAERRTLRRLAPLLARTLAEHLPGARDLPADELDDLVAASDGIPLFVEEITRAAVHARSVSGTPSGRSARRGRLSIPSSLHDTLLARLDQLGPERQVAQLASVIGREFSYPLLQAISTSAPAAVHEAIGALERAELVFADRSGVGARYVFSHALVREAAYETLLHSRRRQLHAAVAEALERQFPQTATETPELVAHHWSEAGRPELAIANWLLAGRRASERSEYREAIGHLQRAIELLPQLPEDQSHEHRELEVLLELAPSLIVTQGAATAEVAQLYTRALDLCNRLPTSPLHFAARWGWWRVSMDHRSGRGRAAELIGLAQSLDDPGLVVQAHHAQWATLYMVGQHEQCCAHADAGLSLYDPLRHRMHGGIFGGHDAKVCALGESALSAWMLARLDEATGRMQAALDWSATLGHAASRVHAMDYALQLHRFRGDAAEVARRADELVAYAVEQHLHEHRAKGRIFRGWARARLEPDAVKAFEEIRSALDEEKTAATPEDFPQYYEMYADVCARAGQVDAGLAAVDEALRLADKGGFVYWNAELLRRRAGLLGVAGADRETIDACFCQALSCAREQGALSLALRAATSRARFCADGPRATEAFDELRQILGQFRQGLASPDVVEATRLAEAPRSA